MAYRTYIHKLDNDSLLQVFSHYRLNHGENWNLQLTWRKLACVCRRWRYLIYDSWSHLDMCLLLTSESPSIATLSHLPPLPLVIDYSDTRTGTKARKDEDNIHHGLQWRGHLRRVTIRAPSSSLREWLELMNKPFPKLWDLSLLSITTGDMNLTLPETFLAPGLRHLSLHGIGLPIGLPLLNSMIALSTLSLTHIEASSYFSPGRLVTQLRGLPYLEELSIGFAIPIPIPSNERELISTPIPPVTLLNLRRLTFRGVSVYLDNLVSQINTPLLEQLSLTILFELAFTLVNLTEFIHRTEGFECLVARVIFNKDGASINADHYELRDIGKLNLHVSCERLDWQIDSAMQVSGALGKALSVVEDLTLDLDTDGMPSDLEDTLDNMLWHELLLPFTGVKRLHIGSSLALELSQALESVGGGLVLELLPELQELDVQLENDHAKKAFSAFVETRNSVDRPVNLLTPSIPHAEPEVRPRPAGPRPVWGEPLPNRGMPSPIEEELEVRTPTPPPWSPPLYTVDRGVPRPDRGVLPAPQVDIHFVQTSFFEYMTRVGRPYLNQAMSLISICQTFVRAQKQTLYSYDELRR